MKMHALVFDFSAQKQMVVKTTPVKSSIGNIGCLAKSIIFNLCGTSLEAHMHTGVLLLIKIHWYW